MTNHKKLNEEGEVPANAVGESPSKVAGLDLGYKISHNVMSRIKKSLKKRKKK